MIRAYIGLGSNLGHPLRQILDAIEALKHLNNSQFVACSSIYSSTPMGPQDQPDYVNAVAAIDTHLTSFELLSALQQIEQTQGRERKGERWGPRTLDLDILLFGNEELLSDVLTIPHYGMKTREFVLYPLQELAPDLVLPCGDRVADLTAKCDRNGLQAISEKIES